MVGREVRGRVEGAGRGSVRGALLELRQIMGDGYSPLRKEFLWFQTLLYVPIFWKTLHNIHKNSWIILNSTNKFSRLYSTFHRIILLFQLKWTIPILYVITTAKTRNMIFLESLHLQPIPLLLLGIHSKIKCVFIHSILKKFCARLRVEYKWCTQILLGPRLTEYSRAMHKHATGCLENYRQSLDYSHLVRYPMCFHK